MSRSICVAEYYTPLSRMLTPFLQRLPLLISRGVDSVQDIPKMPEIGVGCLFALQVGQRLDETLRNIDVLILFSPSRQTDEDQLEQLLERALQVDVSAVIVISTIGAPSNARVEETVRKSGLDFVFFQTGVFMETLTMQVRSFAAGKLLLPINTDDSVKSHVNLVSMRDVCVAVMRVVSDLRVHFGNTIILGSRECLRGEAIAEFITSTLDCGVMLSACSKKKFVKTLLTAGEKAKQAEVIAQCICTDEDVNSDQVFEMLLRRQPVTLKEWLRDNTVMLKAGIAVCKRQN